MSFLTQCIFCNHQAEVPDRALGASGRCPKCSNFFTVVPTTEAPRATAHRPPSNPLTPPSSPVAVPRTPLWTPSPKERPAPAARPRVELLRQPEEPDSGSPEAAAPPAGRRVDPVGASALVLGGAAVLCASASRLCPLVVPLSLLGMAAGVAGAIRAAVAGKSFPLSGTAGAVGAAVLFVALLLPGFLGETYRASREAPARDPRTVLVVPLPGGPQTDLPRDPDGVDASRAALQQGGLRVEVTRVSVGPLQPPPAAPDECLLIRVQVRRVAKAPASADRPTTPRLTVTDDVGKTLAPRPAPPPADAPEHGSGRALFPTTVTEEVFAFAPPRPGVKWLRLEVPVAAWGGSGTFRFTLPDAMIRREPADPAAPPGR